MADMVSIFVTRYNLSLICPSPPPVPAPIPNPTNDIGTGIINALLLNLKKLLDAGGEWTDNKVKSIIDSLAEALPKTDDSYKLGSLLDGYVSSNDAFGWFAAQVYQTLIGILILVLIWKVIKVLAALT